MSLLFQAIGEYAQVCPFCRSNLVGPSGLPRQAETSGKAIGSLVCGLLFFFPPSAILAVIMGHLSLSEIRRSAGRLGGRGVAIAGLVLGYAGLSFIPVLIIAAIAIRIYCAQRWRRTKPQRWVRCGPTTRPYSATRPSARSRAILLTGLPYGG